MYSQGSVALYQFALLQARHEGIIPQTVTNERPRPGHAILTLRRSVRAAGHVVASLLSFYTMP